MKVKELYMEFFIFIKEFYSKYIKVINKGIWIKDYF
jgi:hypothetical protein